MAFVILCVKSIKTIKSIDKNNSQDNVRCKRTLLTYCKVFAYMGVGI